MASTYSTLNRFEKQGTGDNSGTWGERLNDNFIELVDEAIDGVLTKSATGSGDITLTTANGSTDEARHKTLVFTGTPSANRNVIVPSLQKNYNIVNKTDGFDLVIKTAAGSGVTVTNGDEAIVYCDGTDVVEIINTSSLSATVPTGGIIMWSGTIATIPTGWNLCDGSNSTPDLTDRFVVCASSDDAGSAKANITGSLTISGGASDTSSIATSSDGAHTHTGTTGSHVLTVNEIPAHTHSTSSTASTAVSGSGGFYPTGSTTTGSTGGGAGHTHTISSDGAHTHTVDITPPYFALAFIMKS